MKILATILNYCIIGIRPLFGQANCKFTVSCTRFAQYELETKPFGQALISIIKRLLACRPF